MTSRDHNEKTQQEQYEDQQFLRGFNEIKNHESEMAGTKGEIGQAYKRLKDLGWSKKDIEFAKTLEDKDVGQVIADFERKIRVARLFGHQLGRQLELLDKDRTPQEDRAYEEGLAAGKLRKSATNPYQPGSKEFNRWQEGFAEGTKFINADLSKAVADAGAGD
ncbi:hypothetical protein [Aquibium microcysteis]|uniref:hypothetical protein n=1 Tax=Aquibium microcysteis TaxID=675281 RepID=UPI00165D28FF|nr:hypothetical protein [Aquibium microcysteis]